MWLLKSLFRYLKLVPVSQVYFKALIQSFQHLHGTFLLCTSQFLIARTYLALTSKSSLKWKDKYLGGHKFLLQPEINISETKKACLGAHKLGVGNVLCSLCNLLIHGNDYCSRCSVWYLSHCFAILYLPYQFIYT